MTPLEKAARAVEDVMASDDNMPADIARAVLMAVREPDEPMLQAAEDVIGIPGKAAGPLRNGYMLRFIAPDAVVAFPGGRGTQNMISQAQSAGVRVFEVGKEPQP